jgi:hypothetical protein
MNFTLRRKLMSTSRNPLICVTTLIKSPHGIKVWKHELLEIIQIRAYINIKRLVDGAGHSFFWPRRIFTWMLWRLHHNQETKS